MTEGSDEYEEISCPICEHEVIPYWEPRYKGLRASCTLCGFNWAES